MNTMTENDLSVLAHQVASLDPNVLDALPICIWTKDLNGIYQGCNQKQAHKLGFTDKNEIIGIQDLAYDFPYIQEAQLDVMQENDIQVLTEKRAIHVYEKSADFLGNAELFYSIKSPLFDDRGILKGTLGLGLVMVDHSSEVDRLALLTARQRQVLTYLAGGRTYKEIAQFLEISPRTVRFHIEEMKSKLRVSHKRQLIDYYHANLQQAA